MALSLDFDTYDWLIVDGDPREAVLAQMHDIPRIGYGWRPHITLKLAGGERATIRLLGIRSIDGLRLLINAGDLWEIQGFADGAIGGQFVIGVYDTRHRRGGLNVATVVPAEYIGLRAQEASAG